MYRVSSLLFLIFSRQELVKVSKDCLSHLKDAALDTGDRIWVYQRLGSVLVETRFQTEEMGTEVMVAAETCFRTALDLSTSGGLSIKVVGGDGAGDHLLLECFNLRDARCLRWLKRSFSWARSCTGTVAMKSVYAS